MATYTIIRIYQVPADNRIEATDRLLEALVLGVEEDYHVTDVVREPDAKNHVRVSLRPHKSWSRLLLEQLLGTGDTLKR